MAKPPVAIALLACDQVVVEETTRNVTPVNCFTHRKFRDFPSEPISFAVLAFLTDGLGEIDLEVVVRSVENMEVLRRIGRRVKFEHALSEYRCVFRFRQVSFPREEPYEILLLANGELVAMRRIQLEQR